MQLITKGSYSPLVMGSLLAIPTWVSPEKLGLTTSAGKEVFYAMQDYGAYVVDDSGWDYNYINVERVLKLNISRLRVFNEDKALQNDLTKIILKVINNNGRTV